MKMENFLEHSGDREALRMEIGDAVRNYAKEHGISDLEARVSDEGESFSLTLKHGGEEVTYGNIKEDAVMASLGILEGFLEGVESSAVEEVAD